VFKFRDLRPVHTGQQIVAENGNKLLPETATNFCPKRQQCRSTCKVAVSGNNLLPFSATLLPGVDRPLGYVVSTLDTATRQWRTRRRLRACIKAKGGYFEVLNTASL